MRTATPTLSDDLSRCGAPEAVALVAPDSPAGLGSIVYSYAALAEAVDARRRELDLATRSVVVLTGANSVDWIITYLALLADRHVPLLASGHVDRLVDQWAPAGVAVATRDGWSFERAVGEPVHELHSDLGLLMSTSGSTGNPKLVRLSPRNVMANATSIAEYQAITPEDRAITSLPLHYSFGLSVLHSHLVAGAGVVVTDRSVVEPEFATLLRGHEVTNVAGVPHTYELLEQSDPERIHVGSLRFLAQAGGRMEPDRVRAWAERADHWGVDWFSMYGQTEATARMSFVPPGLVRDNPGTIGVAIPGGRFTLEAIDDEPSDDRSFHGDGVPAGSGADEVGEIVYHGPNVMLGYAVEPDDLARGAEVEALRTGDLGRLDPATGFLSVVGRRARRIKPFGLRIDLDDVERRLTQDGTPVHLAGDDELVVASVQPVDDIWDDLDVVRRRVAEITGLPTSRVHVAGGPPPVNANGKIDVARMLADGHAARSENLQPTGLAGTEAPTAAVVAIAAESLGRSDIDPTESFVSLGGDSLSYVECSIRLEQVVGTLPDDWHLRPLGELGGTRRGRRLARIDTTVLLRSVGILAVVSTHMRLWHIPGGAHLMLAVVGYNIARFLLPIGDTGHRVRAGFRTAARVAIPTVLWTLVFMLFAQYTWTTLTLANNYIGPRSHAGNHWHFWFIEVFVHLVVLTTLLTAIPAVRRADVRWPYAFPLVLLATTLILRMEWADMGDWYNLRFRTHAVAWFFVLGWLVQRSSTWQQKVATTVLCLATAPGVFQNPRREYFIALGLVLLVWARDLPFPRPAVRPLATLAAASMWIFISHFMIWPPMKDLFIVEVAYPLTILASLGVWWTMTQVPRHVAARFSVFGRLPRCSITFATAAPGRPAPTSV